jgi:hypothetical protein
MEKKISINQLYAFRSALEACGDYHGRKFNPNVSKNFDKCESAIKHEEKRLDVPKMKEYNSKLREIHKKFAKKNEFGEEEKKIVPTPKGGQMEFYVRDAEKAQEFAKEKAKVDEEFADVLAEDAKVQKEWIEDLNKEDTITLDIHMMSREDLPDGILLKHEIGIKLMLND